VGEGGIGRGKGREEVIMPVQMSWHERCKDRAVTLGL